MNLLHMAAWINSKEGDDAYLTDTFCSCICNNAEDAAEADIWELNYEDSPLLTRKDA